ACVFHQSWKGSRILIVVDDGSTDDTPLVIARLVEHYRYVQVIRNESSAGLAHARNQIMRAAESRYLAWIDASDLWHPRKLALQFKCLNQAVPDAEVSRCRTAQASAGEPEGTAVSSPATGAPREIFLDPRPFRLTALLGEVEVFARAGYFDEEIG